jgi:hypothetical protein
MRVRDTVGAAQTGVAALFAGAALGGVTLPAEARDARPMRIAGSSPTSSPDARPGCSAATRRVVRRFTQAVTNGDADRADKAFAREPPFEWYSTTAPGERLNAAAHDRTTLRAYFSSRIERHEQLRLTRLTARYERRRNITNFHGTLSRSADDLKTATHRFKGAASCGRQTRIIVWSMASGP